MRDIVKLFASFILIFSQVFTFAGTEHFFEHQAKYYMNLEYGEDNYGQVFHTNYGTFIAGACLTLLAWLISRCETKNSIKMIRKDLNQISQKIEEYHSQCMKNYISPVNPYHMSRQGAAWKDEYLNAISIFYILQQEREAQQCINKALLQE